MSQWTAFPPVAAVDPVEENRVLFEAHAEKAGWDVARNDYLGRLGDYKDLVTQAAWCGWMARSHTPMVMPKRQGLYNEYCPLSHAEARTLPEHMLGFVLSPFQWNLRAGYVQVPEDSFKELIELVTRYAVAERDGVVAQPPQAANGEVAV